MSRYRVTADGPVIASQYGEAVDKVVENTGGFVCYLSETPGIATLGQALRPGAKYTWPERTPLYIQCTPGTTDVTTVNHGENAGESFTPGILNTPGRLFRNVGAICANNARPQGGVGDPWIAYENFLVGGSVTPYIDVTNYNSIIMTVKERGLFGLASDLRTITILWYQINADGTFSQSYRDVMKFQCHSEVILGAPAEVNDILASLHLPVRGTHVRVLMSSAIYTDDGTFLAEHQLDVNFYGDNRTLQAPLVKHVNYYWFSTEGLFDTDLSFGSGSIGSFTVAGGAQASASVSSLAGPCYISARANTSAAMNQNTRVELLDRGTPNRVIAGSEFIAGVTGVQNWSRTVILPRTPVVCLITNTQAASTTFLVSIIPEQK